MPSSAALSVVGGSIIDMRFPAAGFGRSGPLVGRAAQLERLQRVLDDVGAAGARFVLVSGDAGAGKTSIVEAFAETVAGQPGRRGARVVCGQSVPLGGDGLPYAPIVGALRDLVALYGREQILGWAGAGGQGLGAILPDVFDPPPGADSNRLQLFETVARLCEQAARRAPLVVILEDIHWADESSRDLLRFLTSALTDAPVMVVATYRTDELHRRHPLRPFLAEVGRLPQTVRIEVHGLDRPEVAELLAQLLGTRPAAAVVDLVHSRSEGMPYFVEELAHSATADCVDMPDTLRDALNVRIQRLSDSAQETLQLAAVAGTRVNHELLTAVSRLSPAELERDLRESIDAAVLVVDRDDYCFRHALLREVVGDDMLPGQLARLHAQYAATLEERPELVAPGLAPFSIAHHWSAAHQPVPAFRWSLTAARIGSPARHENLKLLERALELWDRVETPEAVAGPHDALLEQAAVAALDAGEWERALSLIDAALAETDAAAVESRIKRLSLKSQVLSSLMRPGAVEPIKAAVAELPADAPLLLRARVLDQLATMTMLSGGSALQVAREAIDAAVAAGSRARESSAHNTLGITLAAAGREDEGLAELVRAGELATGDTRTMGRFHINYSDALHLAGRFQPAVDQALAGVDVARTMGLERSMGAMLAGNAAEPLLAIGDWGRARRMIDRALELNPPAHHHVHLRLLLAWVTLWTGDLAGADRILAEFRGILIGPQEAPQYSAQVIRIDGEHALFSGDNERAWGNTLNFLRNWSRHHVARAYPILAMGAAAARALDTDDPAADRIGIVEDALDRAADIGVRAFWRPIIEAELADSTSGWRDAVSALTPLAAPVHLLPYAELRLATHLVESGQRAEAKETLTDAAHRVEAIGAGLLGDRIEILRQRAGIRVTPKVEAATGPAGGYQPDPLGSLTARELDVLRLVAAGRTNGEIGSALFISTKTASVHVSNILAKLAVTGRGEASALAHRAGLDESGVDAGRAVTHRAGHADDSREQHPGAARRAAN